MLQIRGLENLRFIGLWCQLGVNVIMICHSTENDNGIQLTKYVTKLDKNLEKEPVDSEFSYPLRESR